MSLAGRLTAFFLAALALVLVGFSLALYLLAGAYLARQVDDRLAAALHTLAAAAEVKPDGVEWEPHERLLTLGWDDAADQVRWTVHDDQGRVVDRSRNLGDEELVGRFLPPSALEEATSLTHADGQPWRWRRQWLQPGGSPTTAPVGTERPEEGTKYAALVLTAGASLEPLHTTLRNLAVTLAGLSVGVWLLAALLGRRLCRRALVPVTRMAATARGIRATELGQRLPGPETGDELEELGQAFNGLLDHLQEAFERQRRFTGDASHQLRTPLAVMLGQVEVALRRERPPEEYRRVLGVVADQSRRLHHLVEMLLFLARADAEAALPGLTTVDLGPWLEDHLRGWAGHPRATDLRLLPAAANVSVQAHPPLLGQLVDLLLDNACKYSRPGTAITVSLRGEPAHALLLVEDHGCGIAPDDLPRVFDPFFRSARRPELETGGVGLGLAIGRRVATAMGGRVDAESELGRGSRFTVRLVRSRTDPSQEGSAEAAS